MPYDKSNPPAKIKGLPKPAQSIFISAYNSAYKQYNKDETKANKVAWAAVKTKYKQVDNKWVKKSLFRQFLSSILKANKVSQINKSMKNKAKPFKLFLDLKSKSFLVEKDLSKDTKAIVKDLEISNKVPEWAKKLNLESGVYSFGTATNEDEDIEGESVEITDDVFANLTKAPYNKIFQAHDKSDVASGVIKFAGNIDGNKTILEKLNEAHPMFKNFAGSIANGSLDSYSISGEATSELVFDKDLNRNITKRKILAAHEVSRTSCPINPGASIDGLFVVKSKTGGYAYSQEDSKMEENVLKAIQKSITDLSEKVEKSNTDVNGKIDGMAERLGVVETFNKSLQEEAEKLNKAEEDKEEEKSEEKSEDKEEEKKEEKKEDDVEKSDTEKRLDKVEKSLLDHSKAIAKVPETIVKAKTGTPMLDFAIHGKGNMLGGN